MPLSSQQLEAFCEVANEKNFSRAAANLGITQSALSQRIQKLEEEVGKLLIRRLGSGLQLTNEGNVLYQYCQLKNDLEADFLEQMDGGDQLTGLIRVGAFPSVSGTVVLPALAPLLNQNPGLQVDLKVKEPSELSDLLLQGEVDFLILDHVLNQPGIESYILGHETYIKVISKEHTERQGTYLDFKKEQLHTQLHLKRRGEKLANVERSYLGDINSVITGLQMGLGSAILPRHVLKNKTGWIESSDFQPQKNPVALHFLKTPHLSRKMSVIIEQLSENCPALLDV